MQQPKKKGASFGKIVGIFFGGFLGFLILAVLIVKMASGGKPAVVTKPYVSPKVEDAPRVDVEAQLRESERRSRDEAQQREMRALLQGIQSGQVAIAQSLNEAATHAQDLERRLALLESTQTTRPQSTQRVSVSQQLARRAHIASPTDGKTVAIVGNRAWVKEGEQETSVTVGETLPGSGRRVMGMDAESTTVFTQRARH
ncbi:hypothetical protein [Tahibacter amnicola]|uniref:Uncharacterized protein n=1 Tax=Tahibacter amnicola TaxID=2976241 RepID=A0ABY6BF08_9GAMM|nr:hypothetical protein [Tahibacter amnicola]UXI68334.1 hypothetical protein N4264_01400 [Tahibacter amnicola]